jgi:hypothetical protein
VGSCPPVAWVAGFSSPFRHFLTGWATFDRTRSQPPFGDPEDRLVGTDKEVEVSSRGSIRKEQSGRWSFVVDLPASSDQRRQVRRRGFGTRREAQAALTELLGDVQRGAFVKLDRVTVGEYLGQWMESLPLTGRKGSTISSYRHNLALLTVMWVTRPSRVAVRGAA